MVNREPDCGERDEPICQGRDLNLDLNREVLPPIVSQAAERFIDGADPSRYGEFILTKAVQPLSVLTFAPHEGFSYQDFQDYNSARHIPLTGIIASVSADKVVAVFDALIQEFQEGKDLSVFIRLHDESKEYSQGLGHWCYQNYLRSNVDGIVLRSVLSEYEDLLRDGAGFSLCVVINKKTPIEITLDEHKIITVASKHEGYFLRARDRFIENEIFPDEHLELICSRAHEHARPSSGEELHSSPKRLSPFLSELMERLGVELVGY